ncbi:hypothetical protein BG015_001668, partial [Linnemannia schmuckeri]
MSLVRHLRYRRINNLLRKYPDPTFPLRDLAVAKEVSAATGGYDFPYVNVISLEFALFKTYVIPSISKILAATKQFATQCPKQADDTGLLLSEMTETYKRQVYRRMTEGKEDLEEDLKDVRREQLALEKLNFIHGHYPNRQEDYLYTLALSVLEPVSWINRLEWRQITDLEKNALLAVWTIHGQNMKIESILETFDELAQWSENYEHENMVYAPSNVAIAQPPASSSQKHPRHCTPSAAISSHPSSPTVFAPLRRFFIQYFLLPKRYPNFRTALRANNQGKFVPRWNKYTPVYPDRYHIEDLGPNRFL